VSSARNLAKCGTCGIVRVVGGPSVRPVYEHATMHFHVLYSKTEFVTFLRFSVLSGYAMDVIAATAFGLDTRTLDDPDNEFLKNAKEFFIFTNQRNPKKMTALILTRKCEEHANQ